MPRKLNSISPMVDHFMSRKLGEADRVQEKREGEEEGRGSGRNYDRVTISHLGRVLNFIKKEVADNDDPRLQSGFERIMSSLGDPSSNLLTVGFADLAAALREKDDPNFEKLFVLADSFENNEGLILWLNSLVNLQFEQIDYHFKITEKLLAESGTLKEYLHKLNQIALQENIEKKEKIKKIDQVMDNFYHNEAQESFLA